MNLHEKIMNLPAPDYSGLLADPSYAAKIGHRDARHAAAELALKFDAEIERMRDALETIADLESHRDMLAAELARLRDALKSTYSISPEGRKELDRIEKALNFDA